MIRKYLMISFITFALVLLQNSFLPVFFSTSLNPNLVLAMTFALFILNKTNYALFASLLGGLFLDLGSFDIIGKSAFIFVTFVLVLNFVKNFVYKRWYVQALLLVLFCLIYQMFMVFPKFHFSVNLLLGVFLTLVITEIFKKLPW